MTSYNKDTLTYLRELAALQAVMKARGLEVPDLPESPAYARFKEKYFLDPAGFVTDCIKWRAGESAAFYQLDALRALPEHKRVSLRGPHGLGKTALHSWLLLWFALTRDGRDWKAITTAGAWRQLTKFLWPEVGKWERRLDWQKIGRPMLKEKAELLVLSIKLQTGEAFAVASDNPDLIEGAHADCLLYIFDESKSVQDGTYDAAEGAFSTADTEALAIASSTPGEPQGRFFDIQTHKTGFEDWHVIHVTLEDTVRAGRVSAEWAAQRALQWGESSVVYQNRVLGNFAQSAADSVIPLSYIEAANQRWLEWQDAGFPRAVFTGIGSDIAGGGEEADKTTMAVCFDMIKILEVKEYAIKRADIATMEVAGVIAAMLDAFGRIDGSVLKTGEAIVDVIGIGAGVFHRLRELNVPVRAFNASKKTLLKDRSGLLGFANWRAAAWYIAREMLDPQSGMNVCLPPDDQLTGELTAPRWTINSNSEIVVEKKEDVKKRLRRSTDFADAVIQILVGQLLLEEEAALRQTAQVSYNPVDIADY